MTPYTPTPKESIAPGDYELDHHHKETVWSQNHHGELRTTQVHVSRPDGSGERTAYALDVYDLSGDEGESVEIATGERREVLHQHAIAWMASNPEGVAPPEENPEVVA